MLTTLLASQAVGFRGRKASLVSLVAHVIVVGGALAASVPKPAPVPALVPEIVYRQPPVVDLAPRTASRRASPSVPVAAPSTPVIVPPMVVPGELPTIATRTPATAVGPAADFSTGRSDYRPGTGIPGGGTDTLSRARTEHEVDRPVQLRGGQQGPRYPELLRAAGLEGHVTMQFVVDTLGVADRSSFSVVETSHALFAVSVRDALARQRFVPAEAGGRRVRQLVVQTFVFNIHR